MRQHPCPIRIRLCNIARIAAWASIGPALPARAAEPGVATNPAELHVPLRDVRVLVASGVNRLRVRSEDGLSARSGDERRPVRFDGEGWVDIRLSPSGALLAADRTLAGSEAVVESENGRGIQLHSTENRDREAPYPGRLRLFADDDGMLVVNEVDLETYVGCVVANEIWPDFETEAYRAQAIATRTYVLYHMLRNPSARFDVVATQGSQVYRGFRDDEVGRRAAEAAVYTRGLVCVFREGGSDRVFCAYYSAACGGLSQSASKLGAEGDIPPLAGGVRCDWCRIAPGNAYRWGPVRLAVEEVRAKLAARYPEFAGLGRIIDIDALEKTSSGRPVTLRLTTQSGGTTSSHDLLAERFRLAVGPSAIRSTDCRIRVRGGDVVFEDGKGFGHGLGLCQWGMEGQAREGRSAAEILAYYYPGSRIARVY